MLRFLILLIVMSVGLPASPSVVTQDTRPLFTHLQQVILEREPKWRIERKGTSNSRSAFIYLRSGKGRLALMIMILPSAKDATDAFESWDSTLSDPNLQTPIESKHVKTKMSSLGDQNYLWTYKTGAASILFQQKNVFVMVTGTSDDAVKRFALLVSDQLAAT